MSDENTEQKNESEITMTPKEKTVASDEVNTDVEETTEGVLEGAKQENDKKEEVEQIELVEIPKKRLEELEKVEARVLEELKLERANSINYRKRLEKQRDEFAELASVRVLTKLLSVKDDLDRIVENGQSDIPETHFTGIQLLQQRIEGIFNQEKVSLIKIEAGKTKYDPKYHEAIVAQPVEGIEPNIVISIVNAGFAKGDRVLRAAKVIISKSTEPPKEEKKVDEEEEFKEF